MSFANAVHAKVNLKREISKGPKASLTKGQ